MVNGKRWSYARERPFRKQPMELEIERELQEIRYGNRMFTVRPTRLWRPLLALRWPLASSSAGSPMAARSAAFEYLEPHY
jgi:hypothetical protein